MFFFCVDQQLNTDATRHWTADICQFLSTNKSVEFLLSAAN